MKYFSDVKELKKKLATLKKARIVFTNGCFDLMHPGHINMLSHAKKLGTHLVVAINSDASVKRLKGKHRPILTLPERVVCLSALESVDFIISFNETTPLELIKSLKPKVYCRAEAPLVTYTDKLITHTTSVVPGVSTTEIIERILRRELDF